MKTDDKVIFWRIKDVYSLFNDLDSFEEDPAIWRIALFFDEIGSRKLTAVSYENSYMDDGNETMASVMNEFWKLFYSLGKEMEESIKANKTRLR